MDPDVDAFASAAFSFSICALLDGRPLLARPPRDPDDVVVGEADALLLAGLLPASGAAAELQAAIAVAASAASKGTARTRTRVMSLIMSICTGWGELAVVGRKWRGVCRPQIPISTIPVAMTTAAAILRRPKSSSSTAIPISAANTTLVSRIAATSASGALAWAHSTMP